MCHATAGSGPWNGLSEACRVIFREDGLRGFYRGCATNLLRTTPAAALTFTSFELIARALRKVAGNQLEDSSDSSLLVDDQQQQQQQLQIHPPQDVEQHHQQQQHFVQQFGQQQELEQQQRQLFRPPGSSGSSPMMVHTPLLHGGEQQQHHGLEVLARPRHIPAAQGKSL